MADRDRQQVDRSGDCRRERHAKELAAASADSRRLVDSAVISKSYESDFKAGMCACAAHPRSGLAPMRPTRILFMFFLFRQLFSALRPGDHLVQHGSSTSRDGDGAWNARPRGQNAYDLLASVAREAQSTNEISSSRDAKPASS